MPTKKKSRKIPKRYVPASLTKSDAVIQKSNILKSRKLYKTGDYYLRPNVASFVSKSSGHVANAKKLYDVKSMVPDEILAKRTGCSIAGLRKIINKGEGAYYSSGSRPNQTPQSWGYARLASAITGANASIIDYDILERECKKNSIALQLAKIAVKAAKKTS